MLFDIKQFEQFFKESILKKGLKFFEKGELEFVERVSPYDYYFNIRETDLYLKKRGDKLLQYTCSCKSSLYCEHLSAALFYFQQETLGISVKTKKTTGRYKKDLKRVTETSYAALKKKEMESLLHFVKKRGHEVILSEARVFLFNKATIGIADVYGMQMHLLLEPYLALRKLDEKHIVELRGTLKHALAGLKKQLRKRTDRVYVYLAVVQAYIPLFSVRFTGNEKALFELYQDALDHLDKLYKKKLTADQENEWFRTTLISVESNKNMEGETFMFLLPRFVAVTKKQPKLSLLSKTLEKRAYKITYSHAFDKLLIARMEIALKEQQLCGSALHPNFKDREVEMIIAKAELEFCAGKVRKAFVLLDSGYDKVRTSYKNYYNDYLEYIILNAAKQDKKDTEINYLRESFVHRLYILPAHLERFLQLIPKKEQAQEIQGLIKQIRQGPKVICFDKISTLLLRLNLLDLLIVELGGQHNKFSLVHEAALRKYPAYNDQLVALYLKHLSEALKQDSVYNHQVKVFNTAKVFLDKLPEAIVTDLIKALLLQVGKVGSIYRYITEMYDYPFLKE